MIKALFFDLDGTLLTSEKRVSDSSVQALMHARQQGAQIYFASARSPRLDQTLLWTDREFSLFDGGIYCNGACTYAGNEYKYAFIDSDAVRRIIRIVSDFKDVHLSLHMPDEGYAFNFEPDSSMDVTWGLKNARIVPVNRESIQNTIKILIFYDHLTDSERVLPEPLIGALNEQVSKSTRFYITDRGRTVQFSKKGVSKLSAIRSIQKSLNISDDEVSVFGDDVNDLEMISFYKNSVAMGNAAGEIKQRAGFVTRTNDDDGIAHAIFSELF